MYFLHYFSKKIVVCFCLIWQIQASIARIFQRQSDALNKRVRTGKDTAVDASTPGLPPKNRKANTRRGRNNRNSKDQESNGDENENENEIEQDEKIELSSSDEHGIEIKKRKSKRGRGARRRSQAPASAANSDNGCFENEMEARNEIRGTSLHAERLSWGGGGARSHTRHGSASGSRGTRNARLNRLVDHLQNLQVNDIELEVHLMLISLDKQRRTGSQQLHLCCNSCLSVKNLCELVANKTSLEANEVEILLVKETTRTMTEQSTIGTSTSMDDRSYLSQFVGQADVGLVTLKEQETLAELQANFTSIRGNLILAYRRKDAAE